MQVKLTQTDYQICHIIVTDSILILKRMILYPIQICDNKEVC